MTHRIKAMLPLATAIIALTAASAGAQPGAAAPPATAVAAQDDAVKVALDTDRGRIVLALDSAHAPVTTANFLAYVDRHWLDGQSFYRAMPYGKGGLIQGGVRDGAHQLPPIAHEPTSATGLHNVAGAIALANSGPGTARSDFFIMASDITSLDATASDPGFAVFGHVVEGMDVVTKILAGPVSTTKGEGAMKGQMLEPEVKIVKAERVE